MLESAHANHLVGFSVHGVLLTSPGSAQDRIDFTVVEKIKAEGLGHERGARGEAMRILKALGVRRGARSARRCGPAKNKAARDKLSV